MPRYLVSIGVDESDADSVAAKLLDAGYKTETYLLSATRDSLKEAKVPLPVIDVLLKQQQQQTNGKKLKICFVRLLLLNLFKSSSAIN